MNRDLKLFSILYVDRAEAKYANLSSRTGDPIDIYLRCAALLHASCRANGQSLTLLTNRLDLVSERLTALGLTADVAEHNFKRDVPKSIPFYAAHFKLDAMDAFGEGMYGDVVGLVDIDAVLVRPIPYSDLGADGLLTYDISAQVTPEFGADRVAIDLRAVGAPAGCPPCWYGGEFIVGTANAFRKLSLEIENIWPRYKEVYRRLHHNSDEAVVSAALAVLKHKGFRLLDAGEAKLVSRWWTARTNFEQIPFRIASDACFWHLPADKPFLASCAQAGEFDAAVFAREYKSHARLKLWQRRLLNQALRLAGKRPKHVGRLT